MDDELLDARAQSREKTTKERVEGKNKSERAMLRSINEGTAAVKGLAAAASKLVGGNAPASASASSSSSAIQDPQKMRDDLAALKQMRNDGDMTEEQYEKSKAMLFSNNGL